MIPVFVFHMGNPDYLQLMIKQAEKSGNTVFLLGDESNKHVCQNWYLAADYVPNEFETFLKVFVQLSDYPIDFDINCFKRFFIMKDFMMRNNIEKMFFADSDLLIFTNITEYFINKNYGASLSIPMRQNNFRWTAQGHSSFWTIEYLSDFLAFTIRMYSEKIDLLKEKYIYHIEHSLKGGVCDMTLLYLWSKEKDEIFNSAKIIAGTAFDHCIGSASNYKDDEYKFNKLLQAKIVKYEDDKPYCISNGQKIYMNTLHCQGSAKALMPYIIDGRLASYECYYMRYKKAFQRIVNRLRGTK